MLTRTERISRRQVIYLWGINQLRQVGRAPIKLRSLTRWAEIAPEVNTSIAGLADSLLLNCKEAVALLPFTDSALCTI